MLGRTVGDGSDAGGCGDDLLGSSDGGSDGGGYGLVVSDLPHMKWGGLTTLTTEVETDGQQRRNTVRRGLTRILGRGLDDFTCVLLPSRLAKPLLMV